MSSGFLRWRNHVDKLMRFNHMTMTLSAEPFRVSESGAHIFHNSKTQEDPISQEFARKSSSATGTIQYTFDSTSNFPYPFLTDTPRFDSSFEPSLRHLPCTLILHGSDPGGFDVARWIAGGISHVHQLRNPLMPSQFGSYSVYNVQERMRLGKGDYIYNDNLNTFNRHSATNARVRPQFAVPMPPLSLLSPSRPGYLESTSTHVPTFQAQATVIAQLVENLRVPSLHIIAHKAAAPVALELAGLAGFRRRIHSVCLIDPQLSSLSKSQRLGERLNLLGPEWARTRAAYNALARAASDPYFQKVVSELCGTESLLEIKDDPAMAQLYERIGVFFTHWNSRKPGVLADVLMWDKADRKSWGSVKSPILCLTSSSQQYTRRSPQKLAKDDLAREEAAKIALASTRSTIEFVHMYGSGRTLFPLGRASKMCLDFIYKNQK